MSWEAFISEAFNQMPYTGPRPTVFLFSGQGSQYYRMGHELFQQFPVFQQWMIYLDNRVKAQTGESVIHELYESKKRIGDTFDRTAVTHPAIFMVEYALAQTLIAEGVHPACVLGTGIGEFAAAAVAGAIAPEEALQLLIDQAHLLEAHCAQGGLLAVLHDQSLYDRDPLLYTNSELATVHFDSHFVLAGAADNLLAVENHLKRQDIVCSALPVRQAFHSSRLDPAGDFCKSILNKYPLAPPRIPFLSGTLGKRLTQWPDSFFWDVIREPIQLPRALQELEREGPHVYLDLGPGGAMANFVKRHLAHGSQSEGWAAMTPFRRDLQNVNRIIERFAAGSSAPAPAPDFSAAPVIRTSGKLTACVFPGQGAQKVGMGDTLFDEFADLTARADAILGYSIKELCLHDPEEVLSKTQYTQPALYVVNALSYLKQVQETGIVPDFVAGHSLGEYNALFAAGAFDFETGLKLVQKRGELMSRAFGGGMAAVLGFTREQVQQVLQQNGLHNIDIANYNSPTQIVIAGKKEDVVHAQPFFTAAGVKHFVHLNVSGAFHSRYMEDAAEQFAEHLNAFTLSPMTIPVISNVDARPYLPADTKQNLIRQITSQVNWNDSVRYLLGLGDIEITEVGPGNVLAKLVTAIRNDTQAHAMQ